MKITRAQSEALKKIWLNMVINKPDFTFLKFRRTAYPMIGGKGCILAKVYGLTIGIETDGHPHS